MDGPSGLGIFQNPEIHAQIVGVGSECRYLTSVGMLPASIVGYTTKKSRPNRVFGIHLTYFLHPTSSSCQACAATCNMQ